MTPKHFLRLDGPSQSPLPITALPHGPGQVEKGSSPLVQFSNVHSSRLSCVSLWNIVVFVVVGFADVCWVSLSEGLKVLSEVSPSLSLVRKGQIKKLLLFCENTVEPELVHPSFVVIKNSLCCSPLFHGKDLERSSLNGFSPELFSESWSRFHEVKPSSTPVLVGCRIVVKVPGCFSSGPST